MTRKLDELLAEERPELVAAAKAEADDILLALWLGDIRQLAAKTHTGLAEAIEVAQPTEADHEKLGQDMRLSTLKRYVEAMGGRLRIDIELPDGTNHGFQV